MARMTQKPSKPPGCGSSRDSRFREGRHSPPSCTALPVRHRSLACRAMPSRALTSAEISLPSTANAARVQERIEVLADTVDVVGLTDNHAGQSRMSPLAAVALAREQGVRTVVHVSCRDRNRLALQSQVVGAAALGSEGVLCLYGDQVEAVPHVQDLTTTSLIAEVKRWSAPH